MLKEMVFKGSFVKFMHKKHGSFVKISIRYEWKFVKRKDIA